MITGFVKRNRVHKRLEALRERLYRTAYSWCHDRALAQDLVQETSLRAIEGAAGLRDPDAADAWIFSILANCHRMHLRGSPGVDDFDESRDYGDDSHSLPENISDRQRLIDSVRSAIETLNAEQRQVVTLVDIEGFSYAEVASILGLPIGTVMSRLNRARQQLRKILLARRSRPAPAVALFGSK
jgi:RNA polymerase sigma-70 factor (ECF subfamily)